MSSATSDAYMRFLTLRDRPDEASSADDKAFDIQTKSGE